MFSFFEQQRKDFLRRHEYIVILNQVYYTKHVNRVSIVIEGDSKESEMCYLAVHLDWRPPTNVHYLKWGPFRYSMLTEMHRINSYLKSIREFAG